MIQDYATHEFPGGVSIESNTQTAEQMAEAFKKPDDKATETSKAAPGEPESKPDETATTEPEGKEEKLGKPRHDMKARMLEATRKESEAKKERDSIQRRAEAAEAELAKFRAQQKPEPVKPAESKAEGRPELANFDSIEDHAEAVANWVADKRENAAKQAQKAESDERSKTDRISGFAKRMEEHVKADPEFWSRQNQDVIALRPFSVLSQEELAKAGPLNALADHFLVSENAPALIEYFSGSPEELQRLSTLHPAPFWRELGRIEERLGGGAITATPPAPESSKAAPPARPVTGGPPIGNAGPSETDSDDDYIRKRKAQDRKRLTR